MSEEFDSFLGPLREHFSGILASYLNDKERNFPKKMEHLAYAIDAMSDALLEKDEHSLAKKVSSLAKNLDSFNAAISQSNSSEEDLLATIERQSELNAKGVFVASVIAGFLEIKKGSKSNKSLHNSATFDHPTTEGQEIEDLDSPHTLQ